MAALLNAMKKECYIPLLTLKNTFMKKQIFIVLALFISSVCQAQILEKYIGTQDKSEVALDVKGLESGGSVIVGYITELDANNEYDHEATDMLITRVDPSGNVIWARKLGYPNATDMLVKVIVAQNGDFIAVGRTNYTPYFMDSLYVGTGTDGLAAIIRFDASTGAIIWERYVRSPTNHWNRKGDVYEDVIELDNNQICAVGVADLQPTYSDAMITLFDPGGNVMWHNVVDDPGSAGYFAVSQFKSRIFASGYFQGYTGYDLQVAEYDLSGNTVWSKRYDYTSYHTVSSQPLDCNWLKEMHVVGDELKIITTASLYFNLASHNSGILSLDNNTGNVLSLNMFDEPGKMCTNIGAVEYLDPSNAFYTINPANHLIDPRFPSPTSTIVNLSDPFLSHIDPAGASVVDTRRFLINGSQYIAGEDIYNSRVFYAGMGIDDIMQIGKHDIFYMRTDANLPGEDETECPVEIPPMWVQNVSVEFEDFDVSKSHVILVKEEHLEPQELELGTKDVCLEAPCHIDDIKYCGSWTNPYYFDFSTTTTPSVANVIWDFGDGTIVPATSITPMNHTYTTGGSYIVCVKQLNVQGVICSMQCITICVNAVPPRPAAQQASAIPKQTAGKTIEVEDIYPNPTNNTINIPINYSGSDELTIRIMSMNGTIVYDGKATVKGTQTLTVDVKKLVPGNYLCEIADRNGKVIKIVTKQ
jgi:hypothetical protein